MKLLFTSPEGLKIIIGMLVLLLDCFILNNTIAGTSVKENSYLANTSECVFLLFVFYQRYKAFFITQTT